MNTIRFGEPWCDPGLCTQRRAQFECFQRAVLRAFCVPSNWVSAGGRASWRIAYVWLELAARGQRFALSAPCRNCRSRWEARKSSLSERRRRDHFCVCTTLDRRGCWQVTRAHHRTRKCNTRRTWRPCARPWAHTHCAWIINCNSSIAHTGSWYK
jgi:hypothetical protein